MNTNPAQPSAQQVHSVVTLLAVAAFFTGMSLRMCDGLIPRLATEFSVGLGTAGYVVQWFAFTYAMMQLAFGPIGDRIGKLRAVSIAVGASSLASATAALAPGFESMLGGRMLWGMAAAGVVPVAIAWIGDAVAYEERQTTLARLMMGTLSGMVAGQFVGGLFADSAWGWRGAFGTMAVGYAVLWALIQWRLRSIAMPRHQPTHQGLSILAQWKLVLQSRWSRTILLVCLCEGIFMLGPLAFQPALLHQRFGLSLSLASALLAMYAAGGLLYAFSVRHLLRRLGERRMLQAGGWLMGAGYLLWLVSPTAWTAAPVALMAGFGTYLFHNTLQALATQMTPQSRGTAIALFAFCLFFGQAVGVSLAGMALDHLGHAPMMLVPAVALPLLGTLMALALRRHNAG